jgi:hypothetical protein
LVNALSLNEIERQDLSRHIHLYKKSIEEFYLANGTVEIDTEGRKWITVPSGRAFAKGAMTEFEKSVSSSLGKVRTSNLLELVSGYSVFTEDITGTRFSLPSGDPEGYYTIQAIHEGKVIGEGSEPSDINLRKKFGPLIDIFK